VSIPDQLWHMDGCIFYRTDKCEEMLGVSNMTFTKIRRRLGIKPRRRYGGRSWAKYYSYEDLMKMAMVIWPFEDIYHRFMEKRIEKLRERGLIEVSEETGEEISGEGDKLGKRRRRKPSGRGSGK